MSILTFPHFAVRERAWPAAMVSRKGDMEGLYKTGITWPVPDKAEQFPKQGYNFNGETPEEVKVVKFEFEDGSIEEVTLDGVLGPRLLTLSGKAWYLKHWPAMTTSEKEVSLHTAAKKNHSIRQQMEAGKKVAYCGNGDSLQFATQGESDYQVAKGVVMPLWMKQARGTTDGADGGQKPLSFIQVHM